MKQPYHIIQRKIIIKHYLLKEFPFESRIKLENNKEIKKVNINSTKLILLTDFHNDIIFPLSEDIDKIISFIISYIYDSILIKCKRDCLTRSIRIYKIDLNTFYQIQKEINGLLGFNLLAKNNGNYNTYEINSIGTYIQNFDICENLYSLDVQSYKDFNLCKYKFNDTFYIKNMKGCLYEIIMGFDILLLLFKILYNIKCVRISKKKRKKLMLDGVSFTLL